MTMNETVPLQTKAPAVSGGLPTVPWATEQALEETRDYFRRNPHAVREDLFTWATRVYIPQFLRGFGWKGEREVVVGRHARPLVTQRRVFTPAQETLLEELIAGIQLAFEYHERAQSRVA